MQPMLRFGEFTDDLEHCLLESLADVKGGKRIPKGYSLQESKNESPYITVSDMTENSVDLSNIRYVPSNVADKISNYKITVDDIYISVAGTLGIVGRIPNELNNANLTENANKLTNIKCNQSFLLQYLKSNKFTSLIDSTKTTNAQPKLAIYAIKGLEVCLPLRDEQQKIADFLSSIDKKISLLKEKHALLEQYKKGVMQKLFSQEVRFKDEAGNDFPDWVKGTLADLSDKISNKNKDESVTNVLTNSAKSGIVSQTDYFKKDIANQNNLGGYSIVEKNDFVYNPRISVLAPVGPIKRNHVGQGVMSPLYTVFRFKDESVLDYLELYFETTQWHRYMNSIANFGARHDRMNITMGDFFNLPIPIPSENEMVKIVEFIKALNKKVDLVSQQLMHTQTFKKGLLQQMFV
jgi:type I restriction enzyme S subunit